MQSAVSPPPTRQLAPPPCRCTPCKCGVVCDESKVRALLSRHAGDAEALDKYGKSLALSYVEDNARVNFCPGVPWR